MNRVHRWIGTILFSLVATLGMSRSAGAETFYLGYDVLQNRIEWCNHTASTTVLLDLGGALTADRSVQLSNTFDSGIVVRVNGVVTNCGTYNPPNYAGFSIYMDGLALGDVIYGGNGRTVITGNSGDDDIRIFTTDSWAIGGDGDDCLASNFAGNGGQFQGGFGADCLDQEHPGSGFPSVFDCGPNTDSYHAVAGAAVVACEPPPVLMCNCL